MLDRLEPVVPAGGAAGSASPGAEWERDLVDDHHQVRLPRPERPLEIWTQHFAAQVHVRERLDEAHLEAGDDARVGERLAVLLPPLRVEMPNVGQVVEDPPADV